MKKWLVAAGLGITLVTSAGAQAASEIAVVNMGSLFEQVAQKSGVSSTLDNEFKSRESDLQNQQTNLQTKQQRLQRDGSTMKAADRSKLESQIRSEGEAFVGKARAFEQDRNRRSNEERGKLITRIQAAVKKVADDKRYDLVVDISTIAYAGKDVPDITSDVLKQVK